MATDWIKGKTGSWIVLAILLAILVGAVWLGYEGWTMNQDVQMSKHGYIAMALGTFFALLIGIGLMTLVFHSSRAGYDEPPQLIRRQNNRGEE